MLLVPLVFGQMEGHSADSAPKGILLMKVCSQSFTCGDDFSAHVHIELVPSSLEDARVEVLESPHRRSFEREVTQLIFTWRRDELCLLENLSVSQMAKMREVSLCKFTGKGESRGKIRLQFRRGKVQQTRALSVAKRALYSRGCGARHECELLLVSLSF